MEKFCEDGLVRLEHLWKEQEFIVKKVEYKIFGFFKFKKSTAIEILIAAFSTLAIAVWTYFLTLVIPS